MLRKSPKCQGPSAMEIRPGNNMVSSVARRGAITPPHWPANQNAELEKHHVFSSSETVFCAGIDLKVI